MSSAGRWRCTLKLRKDMERRKKELEILKHKVKVEASPSKTPAPRKVVLRRTGESADSDEEPSRSPSPSTSTLRSPDADADDRVVKKTKKKIIITSDDEEEPETAAASHSKAEEEEESDDGEETYPVERILAKRWTRGKLQYKVRWEGYGSDDDSWVDAEGSQMDDLVAEFKKTEAREKERSKSKTPAGERHTKNTVREPQSERTRSNKRPVEREVSRSERKPSPAAKIQLKQRTKEKEVPQKPEPKKSPIKHGKETEKANDAPAPPPAPPRRLISTISLKPPQKQKSPSPPLDSPELPAVPSVLQQKKEKKDLMSKAFDIFFSEQRQQRKFPKMIAGDIKKHLSHEWNQLDQSRRRKYLNKAEERMLASEEARRRVREKMQQPSEEPVSKVSAPLSSPRSTASSSKPSTIQTKVDQAPVVSSRVPEVEPQIPKEPIQNKQNQEPERLVVPPFKFKRAPPPRRVPSASTTDPGINQSTIAEKEKEREKDAAKKVKEKQTVEKDKAKQLAAETSRRSSVEQTFREKSRDRSRTASVVPVADAGTENEKIDEIMEIISEDESAEVVEQRPRKGGAVQVEEGVRHVDSPRIAEVPVTMELMDVDDAAEVMEEQSQLSPQHIVEKEVESVEETVKHSAEAETSPDNKSAEGGSDTLTSGGETLKLHKCPESLFSRGLKIDRVLAVREMKNPTLVGPPRRVVAIIQFRNCVQLELVPIEFVKKNCPLLLIEYYEKLVIPR